MQNSLKAPVSQISPAMAPAHPIAMEILGLVEISREVWSAHP